MNEIITKRTGLRMGGSVPQGITIDPFLSTVDTLALYDRWKAATWGEPLEHRGGQLAITCEMVRDVPLVALTGTYGKNLAMRLVEASENAIL